MQVRDKWLENHPYDWLAVSWAAPGGPKHVNHSIPLCLRLLEVFALNLCVMCEVLTKNYLTWDFPKFTHDVV